MRESGNITVKNAIVHFVKTKTSEITMSDGEMPLASNTELQQFLCKHIQNSLKNKKARSACFMRAGKQKSKILDPAINLISGKGDFVQQTKDMVQHLAHVSQKTASSGAILFCKYESSNAPKQQFLAILKLDPTIGFQKEELKDKGKTFIRFKKIEDMMPSENERLLKCAFIRKRKVAKGDEFSDYDMMVLDNQQDDPARYFSTDFLGTQWFMDSSELTEAFFYSAINALDIVRDDIGRSKAEVVRKAIDIAILGNEVEIEGWADKLKIKETAKELIKSHLKNKIPDSTIATEAKVAERLTKRRVFKGDYGFKLTMDSDGYDALVDNRYEEDGCEVIVLKIPNFEEVVK